MVVRRFAPSSGGFLPAAHAHDHMVLAYFEADGGALRSGPVESELRAGDVILVAPGEIHDARGLAEAHGWGVFFAPHVIARHDSRALLSWLSHPLLFPFVGRPTGGSKRLNVPMHERDSWSGRLRALDAELRERRSGSQEAALAYLTLTLVAVARLAADSPAQFRVNSEPVLADVFSVIESRFAAGISLRDVATAVSLTPGHLTTVVRRKTGRTVQDWITERRMAEAREALTSTDLPIDAVAQRAGFHDGGYFIRAFKKAHGATPSAWRRTGGDAQRGAE